MLAYYAKHIYFNSTIKTEIWLKGGIKPTIK